MIVGDRMATEDKMVAEDRATVEFEADGGRMEGWD